MPASADNPDRPADWYRASFGQDYLRLYAHRDQAEARVAVNALLDRLDLAESDRVLDLCCGYGRHLETLLDRGLDAIGLDLSDELLAHAATRPLLQGRLLRGDMRHLPFRDGVFTAVCNFFSSFGYFRDDVENARVIAEIARILAPGGVLAMDFLNAPWLRQHLVPADQQERDGLQVSQRRWIDDETNTVEKEMTVSDEQHGTRVYRESVKLYTKADFAAMFAAAGLHLISTYGNPQGQPWSPAAERLVMLVRKPN